MYLVTNSSKMDNITKSLVQRFSNWNARNGLNILRWSSGIVFFWFGFIKFFPGASEAENIASKTILWLSNGLIKAKSSMYLLGSLECIIGVGFMLHKWMPFTLCLLFFQMLGACLPLIIFRDETWTDYLFVPTLMGQYMIKNCILISSGIVLGATLRGGALVANPNAKKVFSERETSKSEIDVLK
jgi:uncharacterized membrane protein YkgB